MLFRATAIIALLALIGAGFQTWRAGNLKDENTRLENSLEAERKAREQARQAAQIADAHRKREAERAARLDKSIEALLTGDLDDAEIRIDPRITQHLECLRVWSEDRCGDGSR